MTTDPRHAHWITDACRASCRDVGNDAADVPSGDELAQDAEEGAVRGLEAPYVDAGDEAWCGSGGPPQRAKAAVMLGVPDSLLVAALAAHVIVVAVLVPVALVRQQRRRAAWWAGVVARERAAHAADERDVKQRRRRVRGA